MEVRRMLLLVFTLRVQTQGGVRRGLFVVGMSLLLGGTLYHRNVGGRRFARHQETKMLYVCLASASSLRWSTTASVDETSFIPR